MLVGVDVFLVIAVNKIETTLASQQLRILDPVLPAFDVDMVLALLVVPFLMNIINDHESTCTFNVLRVHLDWLTLKSSCSL